MNRYEDPTVRLTASTWSDDYKKNYDDIFGVKYKLFYSDGSQSYQKFKNDKEANDFFHLEGDHLLSYIKV